MKNEGAQNGAQNVTCYVSVIKLESRERERVVTEKGDRFSLKKGFAHNL